MDLEQIKARLRIDEGENPFAYLDTRGFWTIGNGFCIDKRIGAKLPDAVRDYWLTYLINATVAQLVDFPSLLALDDVRKQLIVCLLYNMGEQHLKDFHMMLEALSPAPLPEVAAQQLQNSAWFKEVGVRGPLYVRIMRTGIWENI